MKTQMMIMTALLLGSSVPAFAQADANVHTETTNAAGTSVVRDKAHSDTVGMTGTRTIDDTSSVVTDPKGLNNKVKTSAHVQEKIKSNGDVVAKTTTVDPAGTERTSVIEDSTKKNWGGGKTHVAKHTETVDPKGLMNKKKVEVEEKEKTSADGTQKAVSKTIDGKTVYEKTESVH